MLSDFKIDSIFRPQDPSERKIVKSWLTSGILSVFSSVFGNPSTLTQNSAGILSEIRYKPDKYSSIGNLPKLGHNNVQVTGPTTVLCFPSDYAETRKLCLRAAQLTLNHLEHSNESRIPEFDSRLCDQPAKGTRTSRVLEIGARTRAAARLPRFSPIIQAGDWPVVSQGSVGLTGGPLFSRIASRYPKIIANKRFS